MPDAPVSSKGRRFSVSFALWWLLFAGLGSLWMLATPIGASPDAPAQVARAVSVARGQWLGPAVPGTSSAVTTYVRVPGTYLGPGILPRCYMFREKVSASCAPSPPRSARLVLTKTHVGRYPPPYYLMVGWPSLLTDKVVGIYLMQEASVLLCGAMLALAVACARKWSRSQLVVPAIGVAATPMAFFLSSQVNPSGLEVAAAIALWSSATIFVKEHLGGAPKGLLTVIAVSASVLVWTRATALVWPLVVLAVLAPAVWDRTALKLLSRRDIYIAGIISVAACLGAGAWAVFAHGAAIGPNFVPLPASSSLGHVLWFVVHRLPSLAQQGVGNFGWLDTPLPSYVVIGWLGLALSLVLTALLTNAGRKSLIGTVLLSVIAAVGVPVVLLVAAAHGYGYVGQGRYFLAIWVAVPLVAGALSGAAVHGASQQLGVLLSPSRTGDRRLGTAVAMLVAAGQAFSFYWALRRYTVGIPGPLTWSGARGAKTPSGQLEWQPPLPGWWLMTIFIALCVLYGISLCRRWPLRLWHLSSAQHELLERHGDSATAVAPEHARELEPAYGGRAEDT